VNLRLAVSQPSDSSRIRRSGYARPHTTADRSHTRAAVRRIRGDRSSTLRGGPIFDDALSIPDIEQWPFDLARVQLAYGEHLRRARLNTASRQQLTAALETFERLEARPWADGAANELRATGLTKPRAGEYARASLTPQEREFAMLAAAGLTNKQIGERLFLSHRTVGGHLHSLFPKLGITTRAALRDALAQLEDDRRDEVALR
jgi:DNA-binding CsgD family transcriptional regulator